MPKNMKNPWNQIIIQKTQNIYGILDLSGPNICKRIHAKTFFFSTYLNAKGNWEPFVMSMSEGPGIKRGISPHNFIKELRPRPESQIKQTFLYHTKPHTYYLGIQNQKTIFPSLNKIYTFCLQS